MSETGGNPINSKVEVVTLQESSRVMKDSRGVPLTVEVNGRSIVPKEVRYTELDCDECGTTLEYDEHRDAVCPDCGLMPGGDEGSNLWWDFNSAENYTAENKTGSSDSK